MNMDLLAVSLSNALYSLVTDVHDLDCWKTLLISVSLAKIHLKHQLFQELLG